MSPYVPLRAQPPWQTAPSAEKEYGEPAPRKEVIYQCPGGHPVLVVFYAEAEAPPSWDCRRCGRTAYLPGVAPEDPVTTKHQDQTTPRAQLRKRRTEEQGRVLLDEALERVRASGCAR